MCKRSLGRLRGRRWQAALESEDPIFQAPFIVVIIIIMIMIMIVIILDTYIYIYREREIYTYIHIMHKPSRMMCKGLGRQGPILREDAKIIMIIIIILLLIKMITITLIIVNECL